MFGYNTSSDRCKMSGVCSSATDRRSDVTACTVLQVIWKPDIHSLYSANILQSPQSWHPLSRTCILKNGQSELVIQFKSYSYISNIIPSTRFLRFWPYKTLVIKSLKFSKLGMCVVMHSPMAKDSLTAW